MTWSVLFYLFQLKSRAEKERRASELPAIFEDVEDLLTGLTFFGVDHIEYAYTGISADVSLMAFLFVADCEFCNGRPNEAFMTLSRKYFLSYNVCVLFSKFHQQLDFCSSFWACNMLSNCTFCNTDFHRAIKDWPVDESVVLYEKYIADEIVAHVGNNQIGEECQTGMQSYFEAIPLNSASKLLYIYSFIYYFC